MFKLRRSPECCSFPWNVAANEGLLQHDQNENPVEARVFILLVGAQMLSQDR